MMELWSKKLMQAEGKKEILYYGYTGQDVSSKKIVYYYVKTSLTGGLFIHKDGFFYKAISSLQLINSNMPALTNGFGYYDLSENSVRTIIFGNKSIFYRDTSLDLYK